MTGRNPLNGKVVLVTGASSGIGEATVREFARAGARVILSARREDRLHALADKLRAESPQSESLVVRADLTILSELARLASQSLAWRGRVDVLVNNAGFGRLRWLDELDPQADVIAQVSLDLIAPILLTRALLPAMMQQGSGCIINVASVAALIAAPTYTVYSAAKYGLRGMSEALRREVRPFGITVSLLCPGPVTTEFGQHVKRDARTALAVADRVRLPVDQVARRIVRLALHPRRMVVVPWYMGWLAFINAHAAGMADALIHRYYVARLRRPVRPSRRA